MNKIAQENAIIEGRADSSYWDVPHSTDIEGFATDMSVNAGSRVDFKINVNGGAGSDYHVEIFRLGYYGGSGAREVTEWTNTNAKVQPNALVDASRGMVDAGNWSVTDSWNVPTDAVSGVYLARVQRLDSSGNPIDGAVNQIPFVVRNDGESHDIVLQTSDTTWQAYNAWGGNNGVVGANLYGDANGSINWDPIPGAGVNSQDRAYAVSYNRPFITRDGTGPVSGGQDYVFGADYSAIYWLEKQGYDVSYISGIDTDRLGASYLENYKSFISVGHDEYWSGDQRANIEDARDAGVNLLFWSGNEVYWKIRWDTAYSADGTAYRTLVCYKETLAVADPGAGPEDYYNLDPSNIWTGTWMDTRFHGNPLSGGGNLADVNPITGLNPACHCAQNQLTGQLFGPDGTGQFGGALDVPANYGSLRAWRDTTVANGGKLNMAEGILGYEWDTSPNDNMRPAGLIKLSETTLPWNGILIDQGNTTAPGVATHTLSLYRSPSGALVFGAGTTFWTWALSNQHDSSPYGANIENTDIQQFTINMFADMGIQPSVADAYLISQGLKRATGSNDTHAAVASIDNLPDTITALSSVTITGTATDNDGDPLTTDGKVAAVEVSIDGGATWKLANSTNNWATWSFYWFPTKLGAQTIEARAIDDSLNVYNITPGSEAITVTAPSTFSAFSGATPGSPVLNNDEKAIELGMRFAVDRSGSVTELRYWRGSGDANDTDVREGHLWRADGTLLATVTFTSGVGQAGWQVATLASPVTLAAGTQYIVSYRTNDHYVSTGNYFVDANDVAFDGLDNNSFWGFGGVVRVVQDGAGGTNGVFQYGSGPAVMPSQSFNGANYWVDVTFDALSAPSNSAPVITSAAALTSPENRLAASTITATDVDVNPLTYAIAGGADASLFTIDPQTGLLRFITAPNYEAPADAGANNVYDLIVSVTDGIAPPVTKAITVSVTDLAENGTTGSNVFASIDAPTTTETADSTDYELGMRFTANTAGSITELRYFRGAADASDTDTRVLHLWSAAGTLLGSVTVSSAPGESGWQVGTLASPIAIQAGATYIVSYGTTQNYAVTGNYFATGHSGPDGVLTAGISSGVFADGTPGAFPTATYNNSNYWADVTFVPNNASSNSAPVITSAAALTSPENRLAAGTITATDVDVNPLTYAIAGGADASLFTIDAQTGLLRFVTAPNYEAPADAGANNVYDLTVSVTDGIAPAVTQAITVSVTDLAENGTSSNVFDSNDAPTTTETADSTDYELGMRFTANAAGSITELRYFRGAADASDTDTRVLHLWSAEGNLLGAVTVSSAPGAAGWQVGALSTPIAIQAGATYIVSYGTTQNYAVTGNYFGAAHSGPDGMLTAGISSGVFANGTPGVFPTATYNNSNYWADVTFIPNSPPVITSAATFTSPENRSFVTNITATDANASPLTYAIAGGADAALFAIDAQTGLLRFVSNPNYEAPADSGANNVYDLTVSVTDGVAPAVTKAITVSVTDIAENAIGSNVFNAVDAPTMTETTDSNDYELGTRFTANAAGTITELRYFRGVADAGDTDTRVMNLWSAAGTLLGSVTVSSTPGESGWQVGTLASPIAIEAGATYIVSYGTTQNYAVTGNYFTAAHSGPDGVLTAGISGGVFASGTPGVFPTASYNASNYWADVTFVAGGTAPANSAPIFTSPATASAAENQLVAATLSATDANGDALTYAIAGGVDAARFTINATTGVLSFASAPNYESPTDAGADNVYDLTVSVTDGKAAAVIQPLAITVTDVFENGAPVFASPATVSAAENQLVAATVSATDPNGDALAYAIAGGADAARFTINATTGALSFVSAPNYEAPTDAGANNVYDLIVSVTDGIAPPVTQALAITVTDVFENSAPVFTSPATASAAENQLVAATLAATDPNGDALTYAIAGGADAARFTINATTGALRFVSTPDYEAPADAGANNVYDLTVSVTDGIAPAVTQALAITVTDVAENRPPTIAPIAAPNTNEDVTSPVLINLLSGAVDPDGNPISVLSPVSVTSSNAARTVAYTVSSAGVLSFDPGQFGALNTGQSELLTVNYRISDGVNAGVLNTATITVEGRDELITGTSGNNTLTGGEGNDIINGLAGNDTIRGNGGNDTINGGANTDNIDAGAGNDLILISGGDAISDTMMGGLGTDTVKITGTADAILTGTSQMTGIEIFDGSGLSLQGTSTANTFDFSSYTLTNLASILTLDGNDTVRGSAGADIINGGAGTDNIDGGLGNDIIRVTGTEAQTDTMAGGGGTDMLQIFGSVDLTLNGTSTITSIETLDGGGQSIVGTTGANTIDLSIFSTVTNLVGVRGLDGNDTLIGSNFADRLDGGAGTDTVRGGGGDDTIVVRGSEAIGDTIDGGAGTGDRILVDGNGSLSLTNTNLITGIERLEGGGGAIVGTSGADTLDFSRMMVTGISSIQGGFGNDTIGGGTGADVLTGGAGNDSFVYRFDMPSGNDRITDFDASGNDVIRLVGFSPSSNLAAATTFDAQGALVHLADIGGSGTIRLTGVTSLNYTTEDFLFV